MNVERVLIVAGVVIAIILGLFFRYELVPSHSGGEGNYGPVYRLNRLTGEICAANATGMYCKGEIFQK